MEKNNTKIRTIILKPKETFEMADGNIFKNLTKRDVELELDDETGAVSISHILRR